MQPIVVACQIADSRAVDLNSSVDKPPIFATTTPSRPITGLGAIVDPILHEGSVSDVTEGFASPSWCPLQDGGREQLELLSFAGRSHLNSSQATAAAPDEGRATTHVACAISQPVCCQVNAL